MESILELVTDNEKVKFVVLDDKNLEYNLNRYVIISCEEVDNCEPNINHYDIFLEDPNEAIDVMKVLVNIWNYGYSIDKPMDWRDVTNDKSGQ